jgi:MOSC domain-containing protein
MPEPEGRVVAIWRYPVKSMLGEELNATEVTERGLLGDRALALIDAETGKVASAKSPRRWPHLFDFRAAYVEPPLDPRALPAVRITLPDGEALTTDRADADARLSAAVRRPVRLARSAPAGATAEGYWPDHPWLPSGTSSSISRCRRGRSSTAPRSTSSRRRRSTGCAPWPPRAGSRSRGSARTS